MKQPLFLLSFFALAISACGRVTNPTPAVGEFAIQGDYVGKNGITQAVLGAQVLAQGSGRFVLVLLDGGLPGDGWDSKGKKSFSSTAVNGSVAFSQKGFNLSIDSNGSSIQGTNDKGESVKLDKVFRQSPTLGKTPPVGAIVLFNGTSVSAWNSALLDSGKYLRTTGVFGSGGATTKQTFRDFNMHLEFRMPFEPTLSGQARGNSGIYLQNRYELQILDSYGLTLLDLVPDSTIKPHDGMRHCGAIWEQTAPELIMSYPPLTWQTYDIEFKAARYDSANQRLDFGFITVFHNGVAIHTLRPFLDRTLLGDPVSPTPGFHRLQEHGSAIHFQNIWLIETRVGTPIQPIKKKRLGKVHSHSPIISFTFSDFSTWNTQGRKSPILEKSF